MAFLKDKGILRWLVLVLVSFALGVNYYFYDVLSPLKEQLTIKLHFNSADFGLIFSAYSFSNVFLLMTIMGGIILDKFGIRISGTIFFLSMVIGSLLTAYATTDYFNQGGLGYHFISSIFPSKPAGLKLMLVGYFLFGLGAESTGVIISKIVVKWFKEKELAFALGLNISFCRLMTGLAFTITSRFADKGNIETPIWLGTVLLISGFITLLVYFVFDMQFDKKTKANTKSAPEDEFKFGDILYLLTNRSFIYITILCVVFYSGVFPFIKFASDFLTNKYNLSIVTAGDMVSLLPYSAIVLTPFFGWICDKKGKIATLMIIGSIVLTFTHLLFSLTQLHPFAPFILLSIAFSLVPAAMWPAVAKIVPEKNLGTAYGFMFTIQNFGLMVIPYFLGLILEKSNPGVSETIASGVKATYNYTYSILMLSILSITAIVFSLLIKKNDKISGYGLENNKQPKF